MPALRVLVEMTPRKTFASALDWPGLARSGRDEAGALIALAAAMPRYAPVAELAGQAFDTTAELIVAERVPGDATTAFGAPAVVAGADRVPTDTAEAHRLAALVEAAWRTFDAVAEAAPESLRKGPRGGGRDRTKIVDHIDNADAAYASVLGRRHRPVDRGAVAAMRSDVLAVLRESSDGSPVAGRRWPPRYAARRIAWHALDHAWEIEDRTGPG
jgi:hypothetical protein